MKLTHHHYPKQKPNKFIGKDGCMSLSIKVSIIEHLGRRIIELIALEALDLNEAIEGAIAAVLRERY